MAYLYSCFAVAQRPRLKKRYQRRAEKVKDNLKSVKDFEELISLQSLFLHFLGSEPSTKARKNLEVVKKSTCFCLLHYYYYYYYYYYFLNFCLVLSGITTRF